MLNKRKLLNRAVGLGLAITTLIGTGSHCLPLVSAADNVEISYAMWDKQQAKVFEEIAREFEAENPNIKINIELTPWAQYWTKLETSITGQNAPDVFWLNIPKSTDYINAGVIEPLDQFNIDISEFPEQYITSYTHEGQLFGVPKDFDTNALWYNKKIFDDAGIPYPDDTWTWEKWQEVAKELTNPDAGIYGMAAPVTWQGGYYETIYQNGGSPFNEDGTKSGFDQPETIEGLAYWYKFVQEGSSVPIETLANSSTKELFLSGKLAMSIEGSYMTPVFFEEDYGLENLDIAPLPKGKQRATTSNSLANVMSAHSKHKEEAAKWIAYLSSEEVNRKVAESGVVIPAYNNTQEAWVNAYPDKNLQVFVDAVEYAVPLPNNKNAMLAIALETEIFNEVWTGNMSVEDAAANYFEKANEALLR